MTGQPCAAGMTDTCGPFCPFAGCEGCRFQGGKLSDSVVPQGKMDMLAETQAAPGSGNSRGPTETTNKESHGMSDRIQAPTHGEIPEGSRHG